MGLFLISALNRILSQYDCFSNNITLNGIQSEQKLVLQFTANTELSHCQLFLDNEMIVSLIFIALGRTIQKNIIFNTAMNIIDYQIELSADYTQLIAQNDVNMEITFGGGDFHFQMSVDKILHNQFDSRNCWKNAYYTVTDQNTFRFQVQPLLCKVSKFVQIFLQYSNKDTWNNAYVIPRRSQVGNSSYQGYTDDSNFKILDTFYFELTANASSNATNAAEVRKLIDSFIEDSFLTVRLTITENDPLKRLQQQFIINAEDVRSDYSDSCYTQKYYATLYQDYSFLQIRMEQIYECLKLFTSITRIESSLHVQSDDKTIAKKGTEGNTIQNFKILMGLIVNFNKSSEQILDKKYYFVLDIFGVDNSGQIVAAVYLTGAMVLPCYKDLVMEVHATKVCLSMFFMNSSHCVEELTKKGIKGNFTSNMNPDQTDASQRETYFWATVDFQIPLEWTGNWGRICIDSSNDTDFSQGYRASGSFYDRMGKLQLNLVTNKKPSLNMLMTETQQYRINDIVTYRYIQSFYGAFVVFLLILIIVGITMGLSCRYSFCKKQQTTEEGFYQLTF